MTQSRSATIFFQPNTKRPRKYKNITNTKGFENNVAKKCGGWYVNYYDQKSKEFIERIWLIDRFYTKFDK